LFGLTIGVCLGSNDPEYPVGAGMTTIEAGFITNVQCDENTAGHSDRQAGDVNQRVLPLVQQASPCSFQVISQHGQYYMYSINLENVYDEVWGKLDVVR